jgi:hypothetical protein
MLSCSQYKYALERIVDFDDDIELLGNYSVPIANKISSFFFGLGANGVRFNRDKGLMLSELVNGGQAALEICAHSPASGSICSISIMAQRGFTPQLPVSPKPSRYEWALRIGWAAMPIQALHLI